MFAAPCAHGSWLSYLVASAFANYAPRTGLGSQPRATILPRTSCRDLQTSHVRRLQRMRRLLHRLDVTVKNSFQVLLKRSASDHFSDPPVGAISARLPIDVGMATNNWCAKRSQTRGPQVFITGQFLGRLPGRRVCIHGPFRIAFLLFGAAMLIWHSGCTGMFRHIRKNSQPPVAGKLLNLYRALPGEEPAWHIASGYAA